ncbi:MAG: Rsd/AlgQ family anti-sigma factor [Acidiferrobacterales bacterium]
MSTKADKAEQSQERRAGTKQLVERLTSDRATMLALFCQVAGLEPFKQDKSGKPSRALLDKFCQVLVDYIAAGHFSLYERIVNGKERRRDTAKLAEELYPRINRTTDAAIAFNDKYDFEKHPEISDELEGDLSRLGEELAKRIELEDQLLNALMVPGAVTSDASVR